MRRAAAPALAAAPLPCRRPLRRPGRGYDISLGARADVVVTDGFTGNVLLKAIEGAYAMAGGPPARGGAPRAAAPARSGRHGGGVPRAPAPRTSPPVRPLRYRLAAHCGAATPPDGPRPARRHPARSRT
ncbi:hypothetical protein QTS76_35685 [Micromonospora sp. b486]|nr:hypothetical protein [Micromonospora sp. b486]MDM4784475.1 hypothetical protein [Micromonospora sp. b486]